MTRPDLAVGDYFRMNAPDFGMPVGAIGRVIGVTPEYFTVEWLEDNDYEGTNHWAGIYFEKVEMNPCANCDGQATWQDYLCDTCRTQQTK